MHQAPAYDDTYKTRLNRVLAWREGFVKAVETMDDEESLLPGSSFSPVASLSLALNGKCSATIIPRLFLPRALAQAKSRFRRGL